MITFANTDFVNKIAFVDFQLQYMTRTTVHLQFYSWGLVKRIESIAPGQAHEYVPGVVHFSLDFYRQYLSKNMWATILDTSDLELAIQTRSMICKSIWNVARCVKQFEQNGATYLELFLDSVSGMMRFSSIEHEFGFGKWIKESLGTTKLGMRVFQNLSQPSITPYSVVLLSRAIRTYLQPERFYNFWEGAAFLRFHDLTGWETEEDAKVYIESIGNSESQDCLEAQLLKLKAAEAKRKKERATAMSEIEVNAPHVYPVALVYTALIDHEEARHYWQMRALRDILRLAVQRGLDPATCTLQMLLRR
ncbi:MAG: hypothetical protein GXO35_05825 [Gammaproteobacteria bacterium]|nr:hypothetical protein [Gammaproteobacteria bacterium]